MSGTHHPRKGPRFKSPVNRVTGKPRVYQQSSWVGAGADSGKIGWLCSYLTQGNLNNLCASGWVSSFSESESAILDHLKDHHWGTLDVIAPRTSGVEL